MQNILKQNIDSIKSHSKKIGFQLTFKNTERAGLFKLQRKRVP